MGKSGAGHRSPRRWRVCRRFRNARSVSDCASPLALRGVTALGKDLRAAQAAADIAVKRIQCEGAHFRHDSAAKAF